MHTYIGKLVDAASKKGNNVNKVNRVVNNAGIHTQTYVEERHAFREHFLDLMEAKTTPFASLISDEQCPPSSRYDGIDMQLCWDQIPSPYDLMGMYRKIKKGKAPEENVLAGFVYKHFYEPIAMTMYPLVLKSFVRIQPPLQWKGGMLCEIFKGKGNSCDRGGYRDTLLSNDSGKAVAKYIRFHLLPCASCLVLSTIWWRVQWG